MDKKLILAIVLSVVVLIGFNIYFAKQATKQSPQNQSAPAPLEQQKSQKKDTESDLQKIAIQKPEKAEFKEKEIEVNTDLLKIVFGSRGARIKNWILKDYKNEKEEMIDLAGGLSIEIDDFNSFEFKPSVDRIDLTTEIADEKKISFIYISKDIKITKEFLFRKGKYKVDCLIRIDNLSKKEFKLNNFALIWGPGLGTPEKLEEFEELTSNIFINEKLKKDKIKKIKDRIVEKGKILWLAISKKFFVAAIIPKGIGNIAEIKREFIKSKETDVPTATVSLGIPDFTVPVNSSNETNFIVYAGPSTLDNLKELKIHKVLDLGWFSGLGILLLVILKFFYKLVYNFGLAIILLTIFIKAILWWPTNKSMKSMKAMQKLQPHMTALKEKHKNNPQQMNMEVMKLYKTHKVNPLGGCLPMILQIPIFYALYMILVNAVELRGEPFYFWIKDLSVKDPFYILPVLMGVTMLIQQKMTPTPDPAQAKIMLILPIVFTFMFINLPSGVVLYWTFQNILSIIQQFHINKQQA